ncbi:MAG: protein of unknown function DUF399, partial [uncultured bacterium]
AASGFIQAQALWDETMAQHIAEYLADKPGVQMVVLAGTQHTRKDSGIPPRVARRLPANQATLQATLQATVINLYHESNALDLDRITDYYFLASAEELPETPKIGVVLVSDTREGKPCLKINQISPHGKAGPAGLLEGDILKEIAGVAVAEMADLHIVMLDAKQGDSVHVKVIRKRDNEERILDFQVELTVPQATPPHP